MRRTDKLLMTTREAAHYLGVSEHLLRALTRRKLNSLPVVKLPGHKHPLFTKEVLDDYVEQCKLAK